jgi:cytochrome c553
VGPKVVEMTKRPIYILFLGFLFLTAGQAMAGGDAAAGQASASGCAGCHGADGAGVEPNPGIAALDYEYLVKSMSAYRSKEKEDMMMNMLFASMTDQDIENLAAYFASLSVE